MLQAALIGAPAKFPFEVFKTARDGYREQLSQLRNKPMSVKFAG